MGEAAESGDGPPALIAIDHDDYHAEHVGHLPDGRQFFLTTPFDVGVPGGEFVALFLFDAAGAFVEAKIDSFGPRETVDEAARKAVYQTRLRDLGSVTFDRIEVAPFSVDHDGIAFGLIPRPPESEDDDWTVSLEPGDYMAFFAPWDDGGYDT